MSNSIERAIGLNNEGVSLLISGQDKSAAVLLTEALMIVKTELHQNEMNKMLATAPSVALTAMDTTSSEQEALPAEPRVDEIPSSFHMVSPLASLEDEHYFIYNQAVTVLPSAPRSAQLLHVYSACIVLNLALAYHRRGRQGGQPSALKKAQVMYEMATKLVGCDSSVWNNCATTALVYMAALNNLSQLHLEQGDIRRAREGVVSLSFLIHNEEIHRGALSEEEANSFLFNGMLVGPHLTAPAA